MECEEPESDIVVRAHDVVADQQPVGPRERRVEAADEDVAVRSAETTGDVAVVIERVVVEVAVENEVVDAQARGEAGVVVLITDRLPW